MGAQDIVEGLKIATAKGESLQKAMTSFYNAGYEKNEIEEAARTFQGKSQIPSTQNLQSFPRTIIAKPSFSIPKKMQNIPLGNTIQKVSNYGEVTPSAPKEIPSQKVSEYNSPTMKNSLWIVLLIILLIGLIGSLIGLFIFQDEILSFFSSIFS